jgi:phenylacetate-coenzyme A ligase PaaK-like adenylate-forming protein/glycosyltransferase involved in cell wall biosynthesis
MAVATRQPAQSPVSQQAFDLSVIVPCFNEEANVRLLAQRVLTAAADADIAAELVFVDDGSTDDTRSVIESIRNDHPSLAKCIRHDRNRGIAAAWQSGLDAAAGAYACFLDADLQHPPEEIVTLYRRLLESRDDIVQGTRSSIERVRDSRYAFSRGLNLLLNLSFRIRAADSKSGLVLAPRRVLEDVVSHRRRYRYFQSFIHVAARAKGYSVLEVETLFQSRHAGHSFLAGKTWSVAFAALADFVPALREYGWRREPLGSTVAPRSRPVRPLRHPYRGWRRVWFEAYFATMPLHKWMIGRRARRLYLELKATERFSAEELREIQLVKLQRLLQHAYAHVPFYRETMRAAGVHPEDIQALDDIRRLPTLSKNDVRRRLYFDLFADNHSKREMLRIVTSGSTGEPFVTYADRYQLEMRFATTLRALEWTGWKLGDRQARLWHQTIGMTRRQMLRERIDALFMRRLFIPAYEISSGALDDFVSRIRRHRPVLVDGYAESLGFLATYVREGGRPGFNPRAVLSSAQTLPESSRRVIEAAFKTKVFDKYGSREFSGIAYQCEASHDHHVMDESYLLEVLVDGRPARPGEVGEVVITDLNNFSVPLIRYRIGDLAVAVDDSVPCACGRHLSRIGRIEGRTQAIVHCADGTWLPGAFFLHFLKEYEHAIRHFQIHQQQPGEFTLKIVPNARFTHDALAEILSELTKFTGEETRIDVRIVDSIPLGRTGKRSPVVSDIPAHDEKWAAGAPAHIGRR